MANARQPGWMARFEHANAAWTRKTGNKTKAPRPMAARGSLGQTARGARVLRGTHGNGKTMAARAAWQR
eukprot:7970514-Lingulodinium_polyedra.AAC.2